MKTFKFASKVLSVLLTVAVVFGALYFAPVADASVYVDYRSSNTALKDSYVTATSDVPVIKDITLPSDTVARFEMYEIKFQLDATYVNPFDPDDIQVDGVFVYPSGKTVTIPAFYVEPMKTSKQGNTLMSYNPGAYSVTGLPEWRIRFAGDEIGNYSFHIIAKDSKGQICQSDSFAFSVFEGGNKGWVDISKKNPSILINAGDGSPYYGSGSNMAWVRNQFTKDPAHLRYNYFIDQATGNTNMTRVWMCHWNWIEWMPSIEASKSSYSYAGLGYYNQCIATAFDEILQMCEDSGMRIVLCTDDNNEHFTNGAYDNWEYNPYNIKNGGPALNTSEYWSNKEVRQYYKKRIRYMLARWGYSSALFSINMWNDMSSPSSDVVDYLKELRDYAHTITDGWRPFLYGSNFKMDANAILDYTTQSITTFDGTKPNVNNECYASSDERYYRDTLRNTIWKELCDGGAATMIWSHDDVDTRNCWDIFKNVLDFTQNFPFDTAGKFKSGELKLTSATPKAEDLILSKTISINSYGDVAGWGERATSNLYDIDETASGMLLHGYVKNLYGINQNISQLRNPPTFVIDAPNGGEMVLYVSEFGSGRNVLSVKNHDMTVLEREFIGPRRQTTPEERYTTIPLQKGENRITLDNIGHDWINITGTYFVLNVESAADMITAHSHVADDAAIIYLENQTYSEVNKEILGSTPCDFTDIKFTVEGLSDGKYAMHTFKPDTGEYVDAKEVTVAGGKVDVAIAAIDKDFAVKLIKLADGEKVGEGSRFVPLQFTVRKPSENNTLPTPDAPSEDSDKDNNEPTSPLAWIIPVIAAFLLIGAAAFIIFKKKAIPNEEAEDLDEETETDNEETLNEENE